MSDFWKGKKVLVTGGAGLVGCHLVPMLLDAGVGEMLVADKRFYHAYDGKVCRYRGDLTCGDFCRKLVKGRDIVFHLAGVKGSPSMSASRPADFFAPMLLMNTNMMEEARKANVGWFLYTSSIGAYPANWVCSEDSMWDDAPSGRDWFPGWAKRMGELQAAAYSIQYGWDHVSIARPASVYGPYDDFSRSDAMVIPALIKRAVDGENPLRVYGDGKEMRDFIHAEDVARGMMKLVEGKINVPVNLASGDGVSIKNLVDIILSCLSCRTEVEWVPTDSPGDLIRVMDTKRAECFGIKPRIGLAEGIKQTVDWYRAEKIGRGMKHAGQ